MTEKTYKNYESILDQISKVPQTLFLKPEIVEKGWGYELIIMNSSKYCGKILHFNKLAKFSMHYHLIKEETFYILKGKILLNFYDLSNAAANATEFEKGNIIHITPGTPHQIEALEETDVIEISTTHFDYDNYRILPGNSQKK